MFSASVTVFASSSPPWSLQGLDGNFSVLVGGLNSANTFSNYIVDTGAVNAYVAALSGTQTATLAAGLQVQVKISNTNTGASTLNVGGTGVKSIKNPDGSALVSGQLISGAIYTFIYDGTNYQLPISLFAPTFVVGSAQSISIVGGGAPTISTSSGTLTIQAATTLALNSANAAFGGQLNVVGVGTILAWDGQGVAGRVFAGTDTTINFGLVGQRWGTGFFTGIDSGASTLSLNVVSASDIKWGRANVALGGGGAPTFGTVGGSGPAATAQRNWLRFIESDGTASFIPVWR